MFCSTQDIKYAAEVAIPVIQDIYERYDKGSVSTVAPNVQHLADIHADTRRLEETLASADGSTNALVRELFERPAHDPTLFGAIDYDSSTSTGFVGFRGTRKGTEWLDDFKFVAAPFKEVGSPSTWVHIGFLQVWQLARQSIYDQLHLLKGAKRIIVTGHSLGAAVASLCALDLLVQGKYSDLRCWTFASPRTYFGRPKRFNKGVAQSLRVYNPVDIVTHVPSALTGFFHVAGGLGIHHKFVDFHSLLATYQPGLEMLASRNGAAPVVLDESEDVLIEEALTFTSEMTTGPAALLSRNTTTLDMNIGDTRLRLDITPANTQQQKSFG